MKSKKTKRALVSSALALVLCFVMLLGTTFAWFTDNASTSVNKVQAGKLDVALEMATAWDTDGKVTKWESAEGKELKFTDANGSSNILWEPGATFTLPEVRIKNDGNLAIKYQVVISAVGGDAKLAEVLTVYLHDASIATEYTDDRGAEAGKLNKLLADGIVTSGVKHLSAGKSTEALTISMTMDSKAGNTYQGLAIDGIAITVNATQYTEEYDSTGNQYDKDAALPTFKGSQTDLTSALTGGDPVVNLALGAGTYTLPVTTNKTVTITGTKDTVIDMTDAASMGGNVHQNGGLDITFDGVTVKYNENVDWYGIAHSEKVTYTNCTIIGRQTLYATDVEFINCTFVNDKDYAIWTWGAKNVTIEGCTFYSGGKAILLYGAAAYPTGITTTLNVNNCVFYDSNHLDTTKAAISIGNDYNATYVLNATNNTINGFAVETEGTNTNSKVYGNKNSMDSDHLTVNVSNNMEKDATVAATADASVVTTALKATTETINVTLTGDVAINIGDLGTITGGSGQYKLGGDNTKAINIDLNGHKLTLNTTYWSALGAKNSNATITVKNGSMNSSQAEGTWNSYDLTFYDCAWNFENVTFDKAVAIATGATTTMKNVVINESNDYYALWITADGQNVTLNNVTINCPNGRAIAIKDQYRENAAKKVTLSITDSKFTSAKKAAVLVTSTAGATITANNVNISGVTADSSNLVWYEKCESSNITVSGGSAIAEP